MVMLNTIPSCLSYQCKKNIYTGIYDWSIYNPTNTCVLIYFIQCKNSQVLKPLSVLTCEVYFSWVSSRFYPEKPRLSVSCSYFTTHKNAKLVQ